ncbi:MAG: hypothetical protein JO073_15885 [Actinobacteria bacterium]|nr:hypothetical protein [Actinomycetota bacterium]
MSAIGSALSGMQAASLQLDVAANDVANTNTPGFVPALGGLVEDMVAVAQAPILYAANAQVVRAADQTTRSLLDVLA